MPENVVYFKDPMALGVRLRFRSRWRFHNVPANALIPAVTRTKFLLSRQSQGHFVCASLLIIA